MHTVVNLSKFSKLNHWFKYSFKGILLVFFAGALLPLAFSPLDYYLLAFVSPVILFYALLQVNPRRAAWLGYWFGLGFFGVGVSWVFVAIYTFGHTPIYLAAVMTFISVSVLACCIAIQGYLSVYFIKKFNISNQVMISVIIFPLFWVLLEWFRGWFMTGFPWLNLGYSQTDSLLSGFAPLIGVYGVSLVVTISSSLLMVLLLIKSNNNKTRVFVGLMSIWIAGYSLSQINWTEKAGEPLKVSLVQGNVEQINKWDPDHFENRVQRYFSLTQKHWDSDLVIWPENSLTLFYHQMAEKYLNPLISEAKQNKTDIIFGLPVLNRDTGEYFSSLMSLSEKPAFYHKSHLVPFGEFIPLASLLRGLITFFDLPMSGFTAGEKDQKLLIAAGQKIAPTICYEDAFGEELIRFLPEATLIINASNNAWYGDSFAPHQHLQISQMRALETGRDVMRVTTNGISALINHTGKITERSPQFKAHVVTGFVQPRTGATPYVTLGNYPVLFLILFGLVGSVLYKKYYMK